MTSALNRLRDTRWALPAVSLLMALVVILPGLAGCDDSAPSSSAATTPTPAPQTAEPQADEQAAEVDGLISRLRQHNEPATRRAAASRLGRMGEQAAPAVDALIAAMEDEDPSVRIEVVRALGRIGRPASPAATGLIRFLNDADPALRGAAASSLGRLDPAAGKAAADRLIEMVRSDEPNVQYRAATALGHLGKDDPRTVEVLTEATRHLDSRVRNEAVLALRNLGGEAAGTAEALVYILRHDAEHRVRKHAALTLGRIDADPAVAVPGLAAATRDPFVLTRYEAVISLGKIGPPAADATEAIVAALDDPQKNVATTAVGYALGKIGPAAMPHLERMLREPTSPHRAGAATALGKLGAADIAIIALLTEALTDDDEAVVIAAAGALGEIGPQAFSAAPALAQLRRDAAKPVRSAATKALQKIMTPSPPRRQPS